MSSFATSKKGGLIPSKRTLVTIALISLVGFLILASLLAFKITYRFDSSISLFLANHLRRVKLNHVMIALSNLVTPLSLLLVLLVMAAFCRKTKIAQVAGINLILVFTLNQILKVILRRPRPEGFRLVTEFGYSFPSGHAMVSIAFYGLIIWLILNTVTEKKMRRLYCTSFGLLILGIGVSRVYLGVHYTTDVLAGFCAGTFWLCIYLAFIVPKLFGNPFVVRTKTPTAPEE